MFELITGKHRQVPHRGTVPILISGIVHLLMLSAAVAVSLLYISSDLPQVPDMLAFVATAPPPPPPPPPPAPPPPAPRGAKSTAAKPAPTIVRDAAPVDAPTDIRPEAALDVGIEGGVAGGVEGGVPGGVEGGIPGGVLGGIVGGLTSDLPPPPPPPQVERGPVRTGGGVKAPALVRHVAPVYPDLAVRAQVQGVVILEALVDRDGRVEDVKVLRSIPLLDAAAVEAVRQWRYSPLLLNGRPERFIATVTVSFNVTKTS